MGLLCVLVQALQMPGTISHSQAAPPRHPQMTVLSVFIDTRNLEMLGSWLFPFIYYTVSFPNTVGDCGPF